MSLTWWNWLVANNLLKDFISVTVGLLFGSAWSWIFVKKHIKTQNKIADLLDTTKPGGLTDLVDAVNSSNINHKGK
jgi:hypothetical protein